MPLESKLFRSFHSMPFIASFVQSFIMQSYWYEFLHACVHAFLHWPVHPPTHPFIHMSLFHYIIIPSMHGCIHSSISSHYFIHHANHAILLYLFTSFTFPVVPVCGCMFRFMALRVPHSSRVATRHMFDGPAEACRHICNRSARRPSARTTRFIPRFSLGSSAMLSSAPATHTMRAYVPYASTLRGPCRRTWRQSARLHSGCWGGGGRASGSTATSGAEGLPRRHQAASRNGWGCRWVAWGRVGADRARRRG